MDETKQPGIICNAIILKKSNFIRFPHLSKETTPDLNFHIDINIDEQKKHSTVTLSAMLKIIGDDSKPQIEIEIEYIGLFSVNDDESNMDLDVFSEKNAPAIIFPYLREHIHDLTLKGGFGPIILPPINIYAALKEQEKK